MCELHSCLQDLLKVFLHNGLCIPPQDIVNPQPPTREDGSQGSNVVRQALDGLRVIFIF